MAETSSPDPADWSARSARWRRGHDRRADEGGRLKRLLAVVVGGLVAGAIAVGLSRLADVPRGSSIVWLELAGTTERARGWLELRAPQDHVSIPEIHQALLADVLVIVFYAVGLFVAAGYLGERGFRVGQWRRLARSMRWVGVIAGALDLLEDLGIWICTDNAGSSSGWLDPMWAAVAAAAWGKFVLLFVALAYVVLAACGHVVTPPWVRNRMLEPTSANVVVSANAAIAPSGWSSTARPTR